MSGRHATLVAGAGTTSQKIFGRATNRDPPLLGGMKHLSLGFLVLAACGGDSTPAMVDAMQVQHDAPRPQPDAPSLTCNPSNPTSCSGENICVAMTCEPAFNRIYHFSAISVVVAAQNPGGSAWDPFGGAPDPWVSVKLNGTEIIHTPSVTDVFQASYTDTSDTEIVGGSTLELVVADSDFGGDDQILDCIIDPLGADVLRQTIVHCDGTGGNTGSSVTMYIDVKG